MLRKVTINGAGTFPFTVQSERGRAVARPRLTTRAAGGVGAVTVLKLAPGRYRISERLPASTAGEWRRVRVSCNGAAGATVEITAARGAVCTFTNRLDYVGAINVAGISIGRLGSAWYVTSPLGDASTQRRQLASTQRQRSPAAARGQSTQDIPFGRYVIQQSAALGSSPDDWSLVAVQCNRQLLPFEQGRVTVRITRTTPVQNCRFVNLRQPAPPPPPPTPTPTPSPSPDPEPAPVPGEATPELALTKTLVSTSSTRPPVLTFRLRVTNRSAFAASRVVVADRLATGTTFVSARPSQGTCTTNGARLVICPLGDLGPGASATILVRVQQVDPRAGVNVAAVGSGTPEDVVRDNVAAARYSAFRPSTPAACRSAAAPIAHAAC